LEGKNADEIFDNILEHDLHFPEALYPVSGTCKSLIKKLLQSDPTKRLGHKEGASELKSHDFYSGIQFHLIRNQTAPIVPQMPDYEKWAEDAEEKAEELMEEDKDSYESAASQSSFREFTASNNS
jgi:hypothetical protein